MADFTLYGLSTGQSGGIAFSPFVWKTKVDLAILGIKPTKEVLLSFNQIRREFARQTGNENVTVPTIRLSSGEYITDSWTIAEYFEKTFAKDGKTLFPGGEETTSLIKFLDGWVDEFLADEVYPIAATATYRLLDEESRLFWEKLRFGTNVERMQRFITNGEDPTFIEEKTTRARAQLQLVEDLLQREADRLGGEELWMVGGKPSHADAVVFGWYAYNRTSRDLIDQVWEHSSLPYVQRWLNSVRGLIDESQLP